MYFRIISADEKKIIHICKEMFCITDLAFKIIVIYFYFPYMYFIPILCFREYLSLSSYGWNFTRIKANIGLCYYNYLMFNVIFQVL